MQRLKKLLPAAGLITALLLLYGFGLFRYAENWMEDTSFQRPGLVNSDIYVIGIDETSLLDLGPFDTWSRSGIADLIDLLTENPDTAPAVIAIDVGFYGEKEAAVDAKLADAVRRAGNVVLASYVTFGGEVVESGDTFYARRAVKTVEEPYQALSSIAPSGFTNSLPDEDGVVRRAFYELNTADGQPLNSFAGEIYRMWKGEPATPPLDQNGQWYIPFSGQSGDYFGASVSDLLLGRTDAAQFAGSVVLIGPYSAGMMDGCYTPVSRSTQMYGVEVHANILQALAEGNFKREAQMPAVLLFLLVLMLLTFWGAKRLDLRVCGVLLGIFTVLYPLAALGAYHAGWMIPLLYPLIGPWSVFLLRIFSGYLSERRERRELLDIFGRYVSPQVAQNIVRQGQANLALGGQLRDIAVLFVDIRGFTSLSETLEPEQVVDILNRYFDLTTSAIFRNLGTVDKFIGDATMALFNAPLDLDDYEFRAVKTGIEIAQGAQQMAGELLERFGKKVAVGVGIHCGSAVVGNIGTPFRMDYTAIGDTVNTASRLEGQAAGGEVIISEELFRRVEGRIQAKCLGGRALKGKSGEITVYLAQELLQPSPDAVRQETPV